MNNPESLIEKMKAIKVSGRDLDKHDQAWNNAIEICIDITAKYIECAKLEALKQANGPYYKLAVDDCIKVIKADASIVNEGNVKSGSSPTNHTLNRVTAYLQAKKEVTGLHEEVIHVIHTSSGKHELRASDLESLCRGEMPSQTLNQEIAKAIAWKHYDECDGSEAELDGIADGFEYVARHWKDYKGYADAALAIIKENEPREMMGKKILIADEKENVWRDDNGDMDRKLSLPALLSCRRR